MAFECERFEYCFLDAPNLTFRLIVQALGDHGFESRWSTIRGEYHKPLLTSCRTNAEISALEEMDQYLGKLIANGRAA